MGDDSTDESSGNEDGDKTSTADKILDLAVEVVDFLF